MSRQVITPDQAEAMLPDGDTIHTFLSGGFAMIGADWSRQQVLDEIRKPGTTCELAGPIATGMGHGLVVNRLFVQTRKDSQ